MNTPQTLFVIMCGIGLLLAIGRLQPRKLVQFNDNTFGVRKHWFFGWHFIDLSTSRRWKRSSVHFKDCCGSLQRAAEQLPQPKIKYTVLKGAKLKDVQESEYESNKRSGRWNP